MARARGRRARWEHWSTERLLQLPMRELGVSIGSSWLQEQVEALYGALDQRGLRFRPHVWLSDEWFSPNGVPGFAIPFYLAHPRLMRLERSQMLDVEGGSRGECTRILRHEAGHAIQHAYQLQRRQRWRELFGRSSATYPQYYRPNPASKHHVQHLRLWYAQSHPDEDFAETFAVWLRPRSDWRRRYAGWPALRKLEYVDELMIELAGRAPTVVTRRRVDPLDRMRQTLAAHYAQRRAQYPAELPSIYDRDLRRLFSDAPRHRRARTASSFLRRPRGEIRRLVSKWTGEYEFTLDTVLGNMIRRCRTLKLRAVGSEHALTVDFAVLLTVKTMHFLYGGGRRQWIAL